MSLRRAAAGVLTVICLWTSFALVRGMVLSAEGSRLGYVHWPAVALTSLVAIVAGRYALRLWHGTGPRR